MEPDFSRNRVNGLCQDLFSLPVPTKGQALRGTPGTAFLCLKGALLLGLSFPMNRRGRRTPERRPLKVLKDGDPQVETIVIFHRLVLELEDLVPLLSWSPWPWPGLTHTTAGWPNYSFSPRMQEREGGVLPAEMRGQRSEKSSTSPCPSLDLFFLSGTTRKNLDKEIFKWLPAQGSPQLILGLKLEGHRFLLPGRGGETEIKRQNGILF